MITKKRLINVSVYICFVLHLSETFQRAIFMFASMRSITYVMRFVCNLLLSYVINTMASIVVQLIPCSKQRIVNVADITLIALVDLVNALVKLFFLIARVMRGRKLFASNVHVMHITSMHVLQQRDVCNLFLHIFYKLQV